MQCVRRIIDSVGDCGRTGSYLSSIVYISLLLSIRCGVQEPPRPNILFILIDSLRSDHVGFAGYELNTTPTLDSLATAGAAFTACVAQAPFTMTSVPSLLSGRYPSATFLWTEIKMNGEEKPSKAVTLGRDILTLPRILRSYGYVSSAFVANPVISKSVLGLPEEFDHFDHSRENCWSQECAHRLSVQALEWIRANSESQWFCFIHFMDVHDPYDPPAAFASRFAKTPGTFPIASRPWIRERQREGGLTKPELKHVREMYDAEIAYLDSQIMFLLSQLRSIDGVGTPLIVVTSDHGDEFMDHGGMGHGHTLFEELTRCPAIISWDGHIPAGVISNGWVQNIDIVSTIIDLLRLPESDRVQGRSLRPRFHRRDAAFPAYSEIRGNAIRSGSWKLWEKPSGESKLFDLQNDPKERIDLSKQHPETLAVLREKIKQWRAELDTQIPTEVSRVESSLTRETADMLRSLGYLE